MRRLLLGGAIAALGCGGGDYLGAGVTAAAGVAAAATYRSATDGCWADCGPGFECDEESGTCVQSPCRAECRADYQCMWVEGQQQCVLPPREGAGQLEPVEGGRQTDKETNHWLCLAAGITDCPDRPHQPLAEDDEPEIDAISGGVSQIDPSRTEEDK